MRGKRLTELYGKETPAINSERHKDLENTVLCANKGRVNEKNSAVLAVPILAMMVVISAERNSISVCGQSITDPGDRVPQ